MESQKEPTEASAENGSAAGTSSDGEFAEIEREVRFAVVIYGGVSLTIYINGIVQEMLNMVVSTAKPCAQLTPLQSVYRDLAYRVGEPKDAQEIHELEGMARSVRAARPGRAALRHPERSAETDSTVKPVHTKFVVDILSGTSAGGINAIYLAKALANGLTLESLAEMWITDADMDKLLNDKKVEPSWIRQASPPSLLNSRWMYLRLLTALDKMNPPEGTPCEGGLVDDLDLFCTTTDLRGLVVDVALTDESVNEQRYRNVYHFRRRTLACRNGEKPPLRDIGPEHDFAPEMDPFLAFAARCTSSFPVAFEPMQLGDIPAIVNSDARFRSRYLTAKANPGDAKRKAQQGPDQAPDYAPDLFGDEVAAMIGAKRFADICSIYRMADSEPRGGFCKRSFGDGGYLDNKPFTYAIETMKKRHADLPVDRKLIYIEPSPETLTKTPPPSPACDNRPSVVDNSLDALVVLPRYETIRQDIDRVIRWNADIARLQRVLTYIGEKVKLQLRPDGEPGFDPLSDTTYLRLRLSGATDQIAERLAEAMGVDPASASGQALRSIAGTWRDRGFGTLSEEPVNEASLKRFLDLFDFDHCQRLIRFLRERLQRGGVAHDQKTRDDLSKLAEIAAGFAALTERPLALGLETWAGHKGALASWGQYLDFITDPSFAADCLARITPKPPHDRRMLTADDDGRDQRVQWLFGNVHSTQILRLLPLEGEPERFQDIADEVARQVIATYGGGVRFKREATPPLDPAEGKTELQKLLGRLDSFFANPANGSREMFDRRDIEVYPIVFGTELGEFEPIDIFRISPNETTPIAGTSPPGCAGNPPLRGASLDAFGAFLDFQWRFSDMLRGRLDGAERLITAVLPDSDDETRRVREEFVRRAQEAIALEWAGFQEKLKLKPSEQKLKLINQLKMYVSTEKLCEEAKKAAATPGGCPPTPPEFLSNQQAQKAAPAKEQR